MTAAINASDRSGLTPEAQGAQSHLFFFSLLPETQQGTVFMLLIVLL